MATWKRDLASGLVVLVPIIVTLWVMAGVYGVIANQPFLQRAVSEDLLTTLNLGFVPRDLVVFVVTVVVFTLLVLGVGYLMRTAVGSLVESWLDGLINRLPGLRVVYNASKMAAETALTGTESLQTPVKIEPWDGMRMTAFKTGKRTADGRELLFMPTAPNITTGFVVEVEPADIEETPEGVETALTRLLSAGFGDTDDADAVLGVGPGEPELPDREGARDGAGEGVASASDAQTKEAADAIVDAEGRSVETVDGEDESAE